MHNHSFKAFLRKNSSLITIAMVIAAILVAFIIGSIAVILAGASPFKAYGEFMRGFVGSVYGFGEMINKFTPLLCCALSFSIAVKSGYVNLGMEGQFAIGSLLSCLIALAIGETNPALGIIIPLIAGMIGGALISLICGVLRIWLGANELLTTLMFNYIIDYLIRWMVAGPIKNPEGNMEQSAAIPASSKLPTILPGSRLHLGFIIVVLVLIGVWFLQQKTTTGFAMRLSGLNAKCARYAGVNQKRSLLLVIVISGVIAGLGGAMELMGNQYKMMSGISNGFGFDGIGIAVMGQHTPVGMFLSALLFGALRVGTQSMQRGSNVPVPILNILQGAIVVAVITSSYFVNRIKMSLVERREK